jgi:hypothetical protein
MNEAAKAALAAAREARKSNPSAPKPSKRAAINGKCKDCIYDPNGGGSWREQVGACTSTDCALFELRPMPTKRK